MIRPDAAAALILAAGRSSRFGASNKLLHEIEGTPIIRRTVEVACRAGLGDVVVVTGHDADEIERSLAGLDIKGVRNAAPWAGMGASLAVGANAVQGEPEAICVLLGDMPYLRTETIERLLSLFDPKSGRDIAVPVHDGRRGHPVLFGRRYHAALRALSGDTGARDILQSNAERIHAIPVDDAGALLDVDTPDDLSKLGSKSS